MDSRAFHALELTKVLQYLAGFAVSEAGIRACLTLHPHLSHESLHREAALFEEGRLFALESDERLQAFPVVDGLLRYLEAPAAIPDAEDLWGLRRLLLQAQSFQRRLSEERGAEKRPLWTARCRELALPFKTVSGLARCLGDDGLIRDEASPELYAVREELRNLHRQCSKKVKDYAAEYNILHYLQDSFMTLSSDRYVLPLKANFKGRLQGVIHDYSQTGETCYFEPLFLVELNNRLQTLKREEREEERKILVYLASLVREEAPNIAAAYEFLVDLDLLFARVSLADCFEGRIVPFEAGSNLFLKEARHPLLALAASPKAREALARYRQSLAVEEESRPEEGPQKPVAVVPSTLELHAGQTALVISGGNAGGKTVSLKTLGLCVLMGLCGLPVPVEAGSRLPAFRKVFAFIGDEQTLEGNLSTFTAQINHIAKIWPELGADSLVILDEFGAGTDPSQGAALAQGVVDAVMERGAYVAAATHFPALKAYALSAPGVRAASVLFDPKTQKPLFRLVYDQVGASRALDVAREHGLPEAVLRRAEHYLLLGGEDTTRLVERLNFLAAEREKELAYLSAQKLDLSRRKEKLAERFEKEREQLFAGIQAEARRIMEDWKSSKLSHKQALKELSLTRAKLSPAEGVEDAAPRETVDLSVLQPRQRVRHVPWNRAGLVLEVDVRKKRVRLDMDGVSLWADAGDIILAEEGQRGKKSSTPGSGGAMVSAPNIPLRLDLRGLRADVAVSDLAKFLDGAILSGRSEVEVIHGKGTGALRRELHQFLKSFPAVASFALASEEHGGDGMTVVVLK